MPVGKFFYVIRQKEDGTAYVEYYTDKEAAQLAREIDQEQGLAVKGGAPQEIELEFGRDGWLLTPDATAAELKEKLGQVKAAKPVAEAAASNATEFTRAARPNVVTPKPVDPTAGITSLDGLTVAFAGRTVVSRPRLKAYAKELGVELEEFVNEKTKLVVVGSDDTGSSKVDRAHEFGVPVISEQQWLALVNRLKPSASKPAASPTP